MADIIGTDHDESQIFVTIHDKQYYIKVDAGDADNYINLEFLFAALNEYTKGILIKDK